MSVNVLSPINQKPVQNTIKENETAVKNSITSSAKKIDKKKLAVGVAAGIGITALVAGGILYNKKINSKAIKQLTEHIEFKEAQTLDDAIKFGIDNLGIKKYKGFKETDLDVINWVNEGLVKVNNRAKGKIAMPKKIVYETFENKGDLLTGGAMNEFGTLTISKNYIMDVKNAISEFVLVLAKNEPEKAESFINNLNKKNNFKYWQNTMIGVFNKYPIFAKKVGGQTHTSTFSIINHEMGHLQHFTNTKSNFNELDKNFTELFEKSKDIAKKVSNYAVTSPTEFVAECYSKIVDGIKLDDDVLDLYKKFGGVII